MDFQNYVFKETDFLLNIMSFVPDKNMKYEGYNGICELKWAMFSSLCSGVYKVYTRNMFGFCKFFLNYYAAPSLKLSIDWTTDINILILLV
jgi:hypothetical protein